jgi:hypothetical protein
MFFLLFFSKKMRFFFTVSQLFTIFFLFPPVFSCKKVVKKTKAFIIFKFTWFGKESRYHFWAVHNEVIGEKGT